MPADENPDNYPYHKPKDKVTSAYSYYKHPLFFFPPPNSRARKLVSCSCETHRSARAADACSKTSQGLPSLDARVSKSASLKPI